MEDCPLAQLVERPALTRKVECSNHSGATRKTITIFDLRCVVKESRVEIRGEL